MRLASVACLGGEFPSYPCRGASLCFCGGGGAGAAADGNTTAGRMGLAGGISLRLMSHANSTARDTVRPSAPAQKYRCDFLPDVIESESPGSESVTSAAVLATAGAGVAAAVDACR